MKSLIGVFMCIFAFSNIYAKTASELATKIANSTPTMGYSFWLVKGADSKSAPYLAKDNGDDSFRVWHFTKTKTWQPIHNASALDGFPKAENVFDTITLNKADGKISFGAIGNAPEDADANTRATTLENKEFNIGWHFWVADKDPFLFRATESNGFRIWHFTSDKKWQPVHNASGVDGFPEAEKTLDGISFDAASGVLSIGKSLLGDDNATKDNPKEDNPKEDEPKKDEPKVPEALTLSSTAMSEGDFLDEEYASAISPALSWKVDDDVKSKGAIKSYAISLKDLDVDKYHWHMINIPSTVTSIPKGPVSTYQNVINDFGQPSYKGPFPPAGETHNYEFSVYGFPSPSIGGVQEYQYAIYKSSIKVKYTGK